MPPQVIEPQPKHWTRDEYYRLAEQGYFQGKRVQLIDGEIIEMPPQGHLHSRALIKVTRWLHEIFDRRYVIRIQMPLDALIDSDPEPDAAVVPGPLEDCDDAAAALLVIEVSDSSLRLDRNKATLYAGAGIQDYWIIDIEHRTIEVYRNPTPDVKSPHGFRYMAPTIFREGDSLSLLANCSAVIKAGDLLP